MITGIFSSLILVENPERFSDTVASGCVDDLNQAFIRVDEAKITRTKGYRLLEGTSFSGIALAPVEPSESQKELSDINFVYTVDPSKTPKDTLVLSRKEGEKIEITIPLKFSNKIRTQLVKAVRDKGEGASVEEEVRDTYSTAQLNKPYIFKGESKIQRTFVSLLGFLEVDISREFTSADLILSKKFTDSSALSDLITTLCSYGLVERVGKGKLKLTNRGILTRDEMIKKND